jgi:hypothetical protein
VGSGQTFGGKRYWSDVTLYRDHSVSGDGPDPAGSSLYRRYHSKFCIEGKVLFMSEHLTVFERIQTRVVNYTTSRFLPKFFFKKHQKTPKKELKNTSVF